MEGTSMSIKTEWILENIFQENVTETHYLQATINIWQPNNPSDNKKSTKNFLDVWIEMLGVLYYYISLCLQSKENFLLNWSKPSNQVNVLCNMFLSRIIPVILKMKLKNTNGIILKQKFTILPFIIKTSFMLRLLINIYFRLPKTCNTY